MTLMGSGFDGLWDQALSRIDVQEHPMGSGLIVKRCSEEEMKFKSYYNDKA